MSEQLKSKTCTPCRGGIPPLTEGEAKKFLAQTPEWSLTHDASRIERSFKFGNFAEAMDFADQVGTLAEEEGHHPDVTFGWGYCKVEFQTHKIHGLHENDFIMAAKVNELAQG
jgi:4a-hydroxytetrahydrobiopterin dehydratase